MGGAAAGKFEVKSCGKAHAWCRECRPKQAAAQRHPKAPPKQHDKACRNCGRCDTCLRRLAPEGMKICRRCDRVMPVERFARRNDTGGRRNICMPCSNARMSTAHCEGCQAAFVRHNDTRALCAKCRPPLSKPCARCGKEFVGSMDQRRYCSTECQQERLTEQRKTAARDLRLRALQAYSSETPGCSCCGEAGLGFLALDHINGGGRKQRQELGGGGFWVWLKNNGYPPGFRVLCHNCNLGRQFNGGVCPHEIQEST